MTQGAVRKPWETLPEASGSLCLKMTTSSPTRVWLHMERTEFADGRHVHFLSAKDYGTIEDERLSRFMRYVHDGRVEPGDGLTARIDAAVKDANYNREAIMYITQSAEIASLERDLVAANKKIEEQDAEIEELKAKYEKLQAETAGKKAETEA